MERGFVIRNRVNAKWGDKKMTTERIEMNNSGVRAEQRQF